MRARLTAIVEAVERKGPWPATVIAVARNAHRQELGDKVVVLSWNAFSAIFPAIVAATVISGMIAGSRAADLADSTIESLPGLSDQLTEGIEPTIGGGLFGASALLFAVWASFAYCRALGHQGELLWERPSRRTGVAGKARQLAELGGLVGLALVASTAATTLVSVADGPRWLTPIIATAFTLPLFTLAYVAVSPPGVTLHDVAPGALFATVCWGALITVGQVLVEDRIARATATYGTVGAVLALMWWIGLMNWALLGGLLIGIERNRSRTT